MSEVTNEISPELHSLVLCLSVAFDPTGTILPDRKSKKSTLKHSSLNGPAPLTRTFRAAIRAQKQPRTIESKGTAKLLVTNI